MYSLHFIFDCKINLSNVSHKIFWLKCDNETKNRIKGFEINPNKDDEMEYYCNKHRVLLDLCDDIALFNGNTPSELPSPWTVLRQMYAINQNNKIAEPSDINIYDLPLFNHLK